MKKELQKDDFEVKLDFLTLKVKDSSWMENLYTQQRFKNILEKYELDLKEHPVQGLNSISWLVEIYGAQADAIFNRLQIQTIDEDKKFSDFIHENFNITRADLCIEMSILKDITMDHAIEFCKLQIDKAKAYNIKRFYEVKELRTGKREKGVIFYTSEILREGHNAVVVFKIYTKAESRRIRFEVVTKTQKHPNLRTLFNERKYGLVLNYLTSELIRELKDCEDSQFTHTKKDAIGYLEKDYISHLFCKYPDCIEYENLMKKHKEGKFLAKNKIITIPLIQITPELLDLDTNFLSYRNSSENFDSFLIFVYILSKFCEKHKTYFPKYEKGLTPNDFAFSCSYKEILSELFGLSVRTSAIKRIKKAVVDLNSSQFSYENILSAENYQFVRIYPFSTLSWTQDSVSVLFNPHFFKYIPSFSFQFHYSWFLEAFNTYRSQQRTPNSIPVIVARVLVEMILVASNPGRYTFKFSSVFEGVTDSATKQRYWTAIIKSYVIIKRQRADMLFLVHENIEDEVSLTHKSKRKIIVKEKYGLVAKPKDEITSSLLSS